MDQTNPPEHPQPLPGGVEGPSGEPAAPVAGSYQRPADYYSTQAPQPEKKSGCPKWLLFGCGGLGCLGLIVLFVGGAWLMKGGSGMLGQFIVSQLEKDADEWFEAEVSPESRQTLKEELARLKEHIGEGRVDLTALQPLLMEMNQAIRDQSLSAEEVDSLNEALLGINEDAGAGTTSVFHRGLNPFPGVFALAA
ncbi:MAG: hypothetical protein ABR524_03030 [Thermoanaerobaculia bacterium]